MSERVGWQENQTGDYCYKNGLICDHNHIDGPIRKFICSGFGGKCINGSKYNYNTKEKE